MFRILKPSRFNPRDREEVEPKADLSTAKPIFNRPRQQRPKLNRQQHADDSDQGADPSQSDLGADPSSSSTPDSQTTDSTSAPVKPVFVGSKQIMPECVVGAKKPPAKKVIVGAKTKAPAAKAGTQMKLSHLDDEEEEEDVE